jgi:flagellin
LNAQRSLAASGAELKTAMERLSSGSKINSASDDAAGFAIAERMTAQIRGLNMAAKNAGDGLSMLSAIENATNDVTDMLQRMRELAVQAVNDTNTSQDRTYLQQEVTGLLAEIDRVAPQTQYNGTKILDGSMEGKIQVGTEAGQTVSFDIKSIKTEDLAGSSSSSVSDPSASSSSGGSITWETSSSGSVSYPSAYTGMTEIWGSDAHTSVTAGDTVQFRGTDYSGMSFSTDPYEVSANSGGTLILSSGLSQDDASLLNSAEGSSVIFEASSVSTSTSNGSSGTSAVGSLGDIDLSSASNASDALATISSAIEQVAGNRAEYGALQNRLEYTVSNLMNVSEFTTAARSRISDADFAAESARLAKAQVLQQSGTAMLAQANASSQLALSLIR